MFGIGVVVGVGGSALGLAPVARAADPIFKVTNLSDSPAVSGSLPYEIEAADAEGAVGSGVTGLITFASNVTGSIELTSPLPPITASLYLDGPGARRLTLNAGSIQDTTLEPVIYDGTDTAGLTIAGLSLDDANTGNLDGGFIQARGAAVALFDDTFADDRAYRGGGVFSDTGLLTVYSCTFSGDAATLGGGLEAAYSASTTIADSTFAGNQAVDSGGAIELLHAAAYIFDSTITGNAVSYPSLGASEPAGYGGGIAASYSGLDLDDSVIADNTATGNAGNAGGPERHRDIYLRRPSDFSAQFSLIQQDTDAFTSNLNSTDITGEDPQLGPLQDNGGQTDTELPAPSSPLINAGDAFGLDTDQRGAARTVLFPGVATSATGDGTDIGAAELRPFISGLSAATGKAGQELAIDGAGLAGTTAVHFGKASARFRVISDSTLLITVPKGDGTVRISVKTPALPSVLVSAERFSYERANDRNQRRSGRAARR